jgi:uncharacterized membrane protein YdfJ with MMPL/SSD domain
VFLRALAMLAVRHTKVILATAVVLASLGALFGAGAASRFTPAGLEDPGTESSQANKLVSRATGNEAIPGFIVLFTTGEKAKSSGAKKSGGTSEILEGLSVALRIHHVQQAIQADRDVGKVRTALDVGPNFVSRDGTLTYITVQFRAGSERDHVEAARRLADRLSHMKGVKLGGTDLVTSQASSIVTADARRAELLAFPILLLLLLWFFRGLVAAVLPLLLGGVAISLTAAGLRLATEFVSISALVLIVVTALGLGLAIDYSLLIVSRFREELTLTSSVPEALVCAMTTAGRTVLFSSLTVIAAFASLLVLPEPFFYSLGLGGALVTAVVSIASLTVLPALLAPLGTRVNSLAPAWLQRSGGVVAQPVLTGRWYRLAMLVMRKPALVSVCATALLVALSLPVLGVKLTMPSMATMPSSTSVRQVSDTLDTDFKIDPTHISEIVTVDATRNQLASQRKSLRALPGVTAVFPLQRLKRRTVVFYVSSSYAESSNRAQDLVKRIRALPTPFQSKVTGATAAFVDLKTSLERHLVVGAFLVALTTFLSIFLLTGSVVLPIKTLLMNTFTVAATMGVLVLVFQNGFLHQLLGYPSAGAIEITQPVALIAIIFGVSTDYGVFLIDRIREVHDTGTSNEQSIALGLERTGRITTAAALLLCVAVGSLLTSRLVAAREVSLGLTVAVLLDATVVRALLVPALMRMLGERNWWSPAPLRHVHARIWRAELTPTAKPD